MLELFKLLTVNAVFPRSLTSISIIICVQSNNFRIHMNKVTAKMFSLFDTGGEPENASEDVVIMEFKVHDNEYSLSPQFIHVFFLVCHIHLFIRIFTVWCDDGKRIG